MVWGVFNGGSGYSPGSVHELRDIEQFDSIRSAMDTFWRRSTGLDDQFPGVGTDASMHIWLACPNDGTGEVQEYPDREITVGPRGGIRVARV